MLEAGRKDLISYWKGNNALNVNINYVLDRNFSVLIGSDDHCAPWNKMAILEGVHYFTTITIFIIVSVLISTIYDS